MSGHEIPASADDRLAKLGPPPSLELDRYAEPVIRPPGPDSELMRWAYDAQQAAKIAVSLAKTQFVPASMQGKPHDITAAILAGNELGLQPMAALRSMDIIHGTPALRAHAMRGLLQSHGHRLTVVEASPTRVVMEGQRYQARPWGAGELEPPQTVEWTIERAAALGLTGKPEWKKQPQTMLIARATGELARLIAADVLYAMPYAAEEIERDDAGAGYLADESGRPVTVAELTERPSERLAHVRGERKPKPGTAKYGEPITTGPVVDQPLPIFEGDEPEAEEWPEVTQPPDAAS